MGLLTPYLGLWRYRVVRPFLQGDILDIGCGQAQIVSFLAPKQRYVGIELRARQVAALRGRLPAYAFFRRDIEAEPLALGDQHFDTVLMLAVIEHLKEPARALAEAARHLHPEGHVIVTTPTARGQRWHGWGARLGLFSTYAAKDHCQTFNGDGLRLLFHGAGLHLVHYRLFQWGGNQLAVGSLLPSGGDRPA